MSLYGHLCRYVENPGPKSGIWELNSGPSRRVVFKTIAVTWRLKKSWQEEYLMKMVRAKNGSEFHFFLHIQIDFGFSSLLHLTFFLYCQPCRLFQYNTSEYSWITYVFTTCLTHCINCSKVTGKKRGNRPILELKWNWVQRRQISNSCKRFQSLYFLILGFDII